MLYELLAGTRPFPGPTSMDFLTQIVAGRFPPIRSVRPEVPRDLELIVGKCLRRDPRERYHSAAELAADLRNWQAGRPVSARPIGGVTAAIKWARRNKPLAASLALTVVALVAGTAVSAWQAVRATAAADRATQEARRADAEAAEARRQQVIATEKTAEALAHGRRADEERVRATATKDLLAGMVASTDALGLSGSALVPPGQGRGNLTIAELLGRGAELLRDPKYQADNRLVQLEKAAFADALGQALQSIGRAEQARPILEEAVAIHRRLLPADHPERMASELHLANLRAERGDFAEAEATYTALLDQHRADGTLDTLPAAEIQLRFCFLLLALKDERGPDLARAGLATQRRLLGERHRDTGVAWVLLAGNLFAQSDQKGGLDAAGQAVAALAGKDRFDRDKDPLIGAVLDYQTAIGYKTMGFSERAVTAFRKAADTTERVLGRDHMYRAAILGELGFNLRTAGHREAAAETWREFLEIMRRTAGVEHPTALTVIDAYADHLLAAGDPNGAWALLEETLRASTGRYGKAVRWRFPLVCSVALVAAKTGRTAAALELTEEALALFRQPAVAAKRDHLIRLSNLAEALGDLPDLTACRKAYEVIHADPRFASDPEVRWFNRRNFGVVLAKKKNYAEAEPHLREAASQAGTPFVRARSQPWQRSAAQFFFGKACWAAGKFDEAAAAFEAASEEERARGTAAEPDMELSRLMVLSATRRQPEVLRRAAERYEALPKIDLTDCAWSLFLQASASTPGSRRAVLDRLERVAGGSTNADVARYRAWAAVVGGGDLTREAERLDKLKARGEGIELARAAVALRRGRPDDALMVLRRLDGHDAASPPVARLRALLRTLAEYRAAPGDPARDAVRAELGAAGKLLDEAATWTNPDLSGSAAATLVALGWWRDRLRDEFAEARR